MRRQSRRQHSAGRGPRLQQQRRPWRQQQLGRPGVLGCLTPSCALMLTHRWVGVVGTQAAVLGLVAGAMPARATVATSRGACIPPSTLHASQHWCRSRLSCAVLASPINDRCSTAISAPLSVATVLCVCVSVQGGGSKGGSKAKTNTKTKTKTSPAAAPGSKTAAGRKRGRRSKGDDSEAADDADADGSDDE